MTVTIGIRVLERARRAKKDRRILHRVHAKIVANAGHDLKQGELLAAAEAMIRHMGWVPA